MNARMLLLCLRLLCCSEHAAHGDMLGALGERYSPKAAAVALSRVRVRAITFRNRAYKLLNAARLMLKNLFA